MEYQLIYKRFGERSILIEWPSKIDENILHDVLNFKDILVNSEIKSIIEMNHAYCSLLITYDYFGFNFKNEIEILKSLYKKEKNTTKSASILWNIPVCYDVNWGIDIETLSREKDLTIEAIINLHTQSIYTIYFIGFLPGFLYLGGLNEVLHTPRKASPRSKIEKGAVAIGGNQTGIYPNESPGGWNIIGNSPINFFDVSNEQPCFAKAGDKLKFYSISKKRYHDIKTLVEAGVYQLESEVLND